MARTRTPLVPLGLLLVACGAASLAPPEPAAGATDEGAVVYLGGTVVASAGDATGLRIAGGRITHVLRDGDPIPPGRRVDLRGATVLPGLVDAHLHLRSLGRAHRTVRLNGTRSAEEVLARVREAAERTPAGPWVRGRGWDHNDWEDPALPSHAALSEAIPDHPVWLTRVDGHAIWVNAAALALASIDARTEDPEGGEILRDASGAPTGVLVDAAIDLMAAQLPAPTAEELRGDLARGARLCAEAGLTGVHDMGMSPAELVELRRLEAEGLLPLRVTVYLAGSEDLPARIAEPPDHEGLVTVVGVKLFADGALGSRGAALFDDYADRPDHRGLLARSPEALAGQARRVHAAGYQIAIHAIGDRGIATALDAIDAAQGEDRSRRHRVEHLQVIRDEDLDRLAPLGVVASMQPTHATSDMPWAEDRVGPARIRGAYAWRRVLEAGAPLAFGSDAPVEDHRPALGLYAAVTRQDARGQPEGGWRPDQRLSIEEALRAFTRGAAQAIHREGELGAIEVGAIADLTVVRDDPHQLEAAALRELQIVATVVEGREHRGPTAGGGHRVAASGEEPRAEARRRARIASSGSQAQ